MRENEGMRRLLRLPHEPSGVGVKMNRRGQLVARYPASNPKQLPRRSEKLVELLSARESPCAMMPGSSVI